MRIDRRALLTGGAALAVAAPSVAAAECPATKSEPMPKGTAVYVPGYFPDHAFANGRPVLEHEDLMRAMTGRKGVKRLLTRAGMDGSIKQAVLPALGHDVEIAPDRSIGVLCGFEADGHCAFDPETLDLASRAPSFKEGWRGGGHAAFLGDGQTVILSERAPIRPAGDSLEGLHGRLTIRDSRTLKILASHSTHGIDPHDIRLIENGRYVVVANYGSVVSAKGRKHTVPRTVAEASITVIETASGKLVDKRPTGSADIEIRHIAAGALDRIFGIQAKLGTNSDYEKLHADEAVAYEVDLTSEPEANYLGAQALKYDSLERRLTMIGDAAATRLMRHGLSVRYDDRFDQAIATYPSSHQLMVFDGETGAIETIVDTRQLGLRYPCGVAFYPDGQHYAVTGYWENLFVFERGSHRLVREMCLYPMFFGHSHIAAA